MYTEWLILNLRFVAGCAHWCRRHDAEEGLSETGYAGSFIIDRFGRLMPNFISSQYHPDKNSSADAEEKFKDIRCAIILYLRHCVDLDVHGL